MKYKININKNLISLIIMLIITFVTQILTIMKSSIVAGKFGTSMEMDAYNLANTIVSFLFGFIASGISTVIIPYYIKKNKNKYVDTFITILYGSIAVVVFLLIIFRYQIIGLFSNKDEIFINISCNVLLILLLSNYLLAISDITVAFFQCNNKYTIPKIITLVSQIFVIIVLIIYKNLTIMQYTFVIASGLIINFILDIIIAIKNGWRYSPCWLLRSQETKKLLKLFLPVVFSTGIYKLSLAFDSIIAARLDTGKITILSYSSQIVNIINTVLIGTILTYIYPKIVKNIESKDSQKSFWNQTMLFHLMICLVIAGFLCVGYEGIKILFQSGKFTINDTNILYNATALYIFGQQTNIVRDLIYRYFYAKGNTKITAKNGIIVSICNIVLSIILVYYIGFYGIVLGTILASFISLIAIAIKFSQLIGFGVNIVLIVKDIIKHNIFMFLTILIVLITKKYLYFSNLLVNILVFGLETIIVFSILVVLFDKKTLKMVKEI